METAATIAERVEVPPSALIRFAKVFDFDGFRDMQKLFRASISRWDYRARAVLHGAAEDSPRGLLESFVQSNTQALEQLRGPVTEESFGRALEVLLSATGTIFVIGYRRAFPVAAYMGYALGRLRLRACLIDGVAGMTSEATQEIRAGDVVVAVSFHPYSPEVVDVVRRAKAGGASVIALTDSRVSALAEHAEVLFAVAEAEIHGFRSLTVSHCLAQALVVALANHLGNQ